MALHERGVHVIEAAEHPHRCPHRACGVVLVRGGHTERRHHCVAYELLDRPPFALDLISHRSEEPIQDFAHVLGVELFSERRGTGHVGEQDRDELPFVPGTGGLDGRGRTARGTEPSIRRQRLAARVTGSGERAATRGTEPTSVGVLGGTCRAGAHAPECIRGDRW